MKSICLTQLFQEMLEIITTKLCIYLWSYHVDRYQCSVSSLRKKTLKYYHEPSRRLNFIT